MSWHYSQALVEDFSRRGCLDGEQCARLKSIRTVEKSCFGGRKTATSSRSPSGTMCAPLTVAIGLAGWMLSAAGSPARTSRAPERARGSTVPAPAFGLSSLASFARYDPASCSWRIPQCSLLEGWESYSETWPRAGLMHDGACYPQPNAERRIREIDYGSLLATATATANQTCPSMQKHPGCRALLPTPVAYDATPGGPNNHYRGLGHMAKWPTIRSTDADRGGRGDLIQAVRGNKNSHLKTCPTPTAHLQDMGTMEMARSSGTARKAGKPEAQYNPANGGQLNPTWVEWLMGWPLRWTALEFSDSELSATDRFRQWLEQHGGC